MSTLDKLRALHKEVCHCWRNHYIGCTSDGEADILNIGFILLERIASLAGDNRRFTDCIDWDCRVDISKYLQRVYSQFDSDADIKITSQ